MIDVFMCSDDNYAEFIATTIVSICENTQEDIFVHVLSYGISGKKKQGIYDSLKRYGDRCKIVFYNDSAEKLSGFVETSYISKAMYGRFFLPDMVETNKAIYTDVDVIFHGDIAELFNQELLEHTIGAVPETFNEGNGVNDERKCRLGLSDRHRYFSSGLLLINCSRWRQENILQKLLNAEKLLRNKLDCPDQDIFNYVFNENYKELSSDWAVVNQISRKVKNIKIRHYNGKYKPWNYPQRSVKFIRKFGLGDQFWNYAKMTAFYHSLAVLAEERQRNSLLLKIYGSIFNIKK